MAVFLATLAVRGAWPDFTSCWVSEELETRNAVHVALAGRWENGGWAAAQIWPKGVYLGSEAVARLNQEKLPWTRKECDGLFSPPSSNPPRTSSNLPRTVFPG